MAATAKFQVLSLSNADTRVRDYKRRKAHTKTRSGCLSCRTKRVKCDESRPVCTRCRRNNRQCAYGEAQACARSPTRTTTERRNGCVSLLSAVTVDPFRSPNSNGTPAVTLMQHWYRDWTDVFSISFSADVISLSQTSGLVRNTMLAIAACHLRHVAPGIIQHRVAEHFQLSLALHDYRAAMNTPQEQLGQTGADGLLMSAMMLTMLAFALPESEMSDDPTLAWVCDSRNDRLLWLSLQTGVHNLLRSMTMFLHNTTNFLSRTFLDLGIDHSPLVKVAHDGDLDAIPELWVRVFELDVRYSDGSNDGDGEVVPRARDVFRAPVKILARLRHFEPVRSNLFQNFLFISKANLEFQALLHRRDERALWLFGFWLGLMCRFDIAWWSYGRVMRDYKGVYAWLDGLQLAGRPGREGRLWNAMMKELELAPVYTPQEAC